MEIPAAAFYPKTNSSRFLEVESISFSSDGEFGGPEGTIIMKILERKLEVIVECISVNWIMIKPWKASKLYVRRLPSSCNQEVIEIATSRNGDKYLHPLRITKRGNSFSFPTGFCGNIKVNCPKPQPSSWEDHMMKKGFVEKKELWITSNEAVCPDIISTLDRLLHVHVEYSKDDAQGRAIYCITPLHPDKLFYKSEAGERKISIATSIASIIELLKTERGYCLCVENNIEFDLF